MTARPGEMRPRRAGDGTTAFDARVQGNVHGRGAGVELWGDDDGARVCRA